MTAAVGGGVAEVGRVVGQAAVIDNAEGSAGDAVHGQDDLDESAEG